MNRLLARWDFPGRNSCDGRAVSDILRDNGTGADDRSLSDRHARQNHAMDADECSDPDSRFGDLRLFSAGVRVRLVVRENRRPGGDGHVVFYHDHLRVEVIENHEIADLHVPPDSDAASPVERSAQGRARAEPRRKEKRGGSQPHPQRAARPSLHGGWSDMAVINLRALDFQRREPAAQGLRSHRGKVGTVGRSGAEGGH